MDRADMVNLYAQCDRRLVMRIDLENLMLDETYWSRKLSEEYGEDYYYEFEEDEENDE